MIERLKFGMYNTYLIRGEKRSVLVDTGSGKEKEGIFEQVRHKNVGLIVLTHGHIDHVGGTPFLAQRLCVPIAVHKDDYDLLSDNTLRQLFADSFSGRVIKAASEQMFHSSKMPAFEPDMFLEDGQTLEEYGVDAKVLTLPGHTKGSIGLLVDGKDLVVGDAMMNLRKPSAALWYEDKLAMEESLEKIRESGAEMIYPGHGNPFAAKEYFNKEKIRKCNQ